MADDIDMTDFAFMPIGSNSSPFTSIFDGNIVLNAMNDALLINQIKLAAQPDYVFNPFCDLNHDNVINIRDYEVFLNILNGITLTTNNTL